MKRSQLKEEPTHQFQPLVDLVQKLGFELLEIQMQGLVRFSGGALTSENADFSIKVGKGRYRSWPDEVWDLTEGLKVFTGLGHLDTAMGTDSLRVDLTSRPLLPGTKAAKLTLGTRPHQLAPGVGSGETDPNPQETHNLTPRPVSGPPKGNPPRGKGVQRAQLLEDD